MLLQNNITAEERDALELEKASHLEEGKTQRKSWASFLKKYLDLKDTNNKIETILLPKQIADEKILRDVDKFDVSGVQMQAEDLGGRLTMPFYSVRRPSVDYFISNLAIQNFVS